MLRALPLEVKVRKTQERIKEWVDFYGEEGVYVSFSGGKDSTLLLHLARQLYPNIPAVFSDTGLEYPAIRNFVALHNNVSWIRPAMNFRDVLIQYGYPVIGKEVAECVWAVRHSKGEAYAKNRLERLMGTSRRKDGQLSQYNRPKYRFLLDAPFEISPHCCQKMKKDPMKKYSKETKRVSLLATMTEESRLREGKWLKSGCNSFESKEPNSTPMAFWTEQDVLQYLFLHQEEILETMQGAEGLEHPWASCYGEIRPTVKSNELEGQISVQELLKDCRECRMHTTGCKRTGCIFCLFGITQDPDRLLKVQREEPAIADYILRGGEFNGQGMWQPGRGGLGFWFVVRWLCIHGKLEIPIEGAEEYGQKYGNQTTKNLLKP